MPLKQGCQVSGYSVAAVVYVRRPDFDPSRILSSIA